MLELNTKVLVHELGIYSQKSVLLHDNI